MKVAEASKKAGMSEQFIRIAIQQNRLPFGNCCKMPKSTRYTYHINEAALDRYLKGES